MLSEENRKLTEERRAEIKSHADDFYSSPHLLAGDVYELLAHIDRLAASPSPPTDAEGIQPGNQLEEILALRLAFSRLMANSRHVNHFIMVDAEIWNDVQKKIREPMLAGYALDEMAKLRASAAPVTREQIAQTLSLMFCNPVSRLPLYEAQSATQYADKEFWLSRADVIMGLISAPPSHGTDK